MFCPGLWDGGLVRRQGDVAVVAEPTRAVDRPRLLDRRGDGGGDGRQVLLGDLRRFRVRRPQLDLLEQLPSFVGLAVAQQRHGLIVLRRLAHRRILRRLGEQCLGALRVAQAQLRQTEKERRGEAVRGLRVGALQPFLRRLILAGLEVQNAEIEHRRLQVGTQRQRMAQVGDGLVGRAQTGVGQAAVVGHQRVIGVGRGRVVQQRARLFPTVGVERDKGPGVELL